MTEQEKYKSERYSEFIHNSGLEDTEQLKDAFEQEIQTALDDKGDACANAIDDRLYEATNINNFISYEIKIILQENIRNAIPQTKEVGITDDERRQTEYDAEHGT